MLSGCEDSYNFPNEAPSELSIIKNECYVIVEQEVDLLGEAYDEDGDPIYFQWSATAGSFEPADGKGPSVIWKAPQTPGRVTITLSVTDEIETSRTSVAIDVGGLFPGYIPESITIADSGYVYILDRLQAVRIPAGVTMTITEGVKIVINNENSGLDVEGTLIVQGAQGNEVVIGPSSCEPSEGDWAGVRITWRSGWGELDFLSVHSAENGVKVTGYAGAAMRNCSIYNNLTNGVEVSDSSSLSMTNCTVWENGTGVYVRNSTLDMQRSSVRYNDDIGLELSATSGLFTIEIDTCAIANNERYGVYITGIAKPEIHYCSIYSNGMTGEGEAVKLEAYVASDSVRVDYNFWGIGNNSEEAIAELVYDMFDSPIGIMAYIDFIPWLTAQPDGVP